MSLSLTVTVLCVNVYICYCVAIVDDDRYGLGVDRFFGCVDLCMAFFYFKPCQLLSSYSLVVTISH